jgi:hypothetical protein
MMEHENTYTQPVSGRDRLFEALEKKGYTPTDFAMTQHASIQRWLVIAADTTGRDRPTLRILGTVAELLTEIDKLPGVQ